MPCLIVKGLDEFLTKGLNLETEAKLRTNCSILKPTNLSLKRYKNPSPNFFFFNISKVNFIKEEKLEETIQTTILRPLNCTR